MGWEETENQANQIAIQVMNAFFTLLYAEEEVRITQEQVENSRLRLKKIEREYELGKAESDLFEMQAQQASVEFGWSRHKIIVSTHRLILNILWIITRKRS